jgi:hypothetical protein
MPLNRAMGYAAPGVLPKAQMIDSIRTAADARADMVLIARCLAPTPNGSDTELLDRLPPVPKPVRTSYGSGCAARTNTQRRPT